MNDKSSFSSLSSLTISNQLQDQSWSLVSIQIWIDTIINHVSNEIEVWGRNTHAQTNRKGLKNKTFVMIVLGGEGGSFA